MIISEDSAWVEGFNDYGESDDCPYSYPDLKEAWYSGWWHGFAAFAVYSSAYGH